jgi:hypothetical protein
MCYVRFSDMAALLDAARSVVAEREAAAREEGGT